MQYTTQRKRNEKSHDHLDRCRKSCLQNSTVNEQSLKKLVTAGTCYSITKATNAKSKANGILNVEKLKALPLKPETRKRCACSPLLPKIASEVLVKAIRKRKEKK